MESLTIFGKNLKSIRLSMEMSQEQLAEKCDLHRTYIGLLESGKRNPSLLTIVLIAEQLQCTIFELLEGI